MLGDFLRMTTSNTYPLVVPNIAIAGRFPFLIRKYIDSIRETIFQPAMLVDPGVYKDPYLPFTRISWFMSPQVGFGSLLRLGSFFEKSFHEGGCYIITIPSTLRYINF